MCMYAFCGGLGDGGGGYGGDQNDHGNDMMYVSNSEGDFVLCPSMHTAPQHTDITKLWQSNLCYAI